ncbi:MAG: acyltransferase [Myxococcota bacterium]|nr:acyltransferase [Myxococcota bacterium]
MDFSLRKDYRSHGSGRDWQGQLASLGDAAVVEDSVRIFHPASVSIGQGVYVGHDVVLDGYHAGALTIGEGTWIGAACFLHGAAGLHIGRCVGIGPRVVMLTSEHELHRVSVPVLHAPLRLRQVRIGDGADIGAGAIILPGSEIGEGAVIGAGAVVSGEIPAFAVAVGCPAKVVRIRGTGAGG